MPELVRRDISGISLLTDDALFERTGIRIAFTTRHGGASAHPYSSLNMGLHVGDVEEDVLANRRAALAAAGADEGVSVVSLNQVHGSNVEIVEDPSQNSLDAVRRRASEGCDGLVVSCPDVCALLCFADCMPLILASRTGAFAVVHAGWRGVVSRIAANAVSALEKASGDVPETFNAYIGPYIHGECFEVSDDVRDVFASEFGEHVVHGERNVDLGRAMLDTLQSAGIDPSRVADCGCCTVCNAADFYSYRAEGGTCGRHSAFAFRR